MLETVLIIFGFYKTIQYLLGLFSTLRRCFIRQPINFQESYKITNDTWTIITGASDGIGKQFAIDLAQKGLNLLLVGRNEEKLKKVQSELQALSPNIQIKIFIIDFAKGHSVDYYKPFLEQIQSLKDIALLINNAGVGGFRNYFADYPEDLVFDMVTVNCFPISYLMKAIIPHMLQRSGRSGIINVSSVCGVRPFPFIAVYSATKGYSDFLSRASAQEVLDKIDIICLRPNTVATKMTHIKPGGLILTVEECTHGCIQHLGYEYYTDGHWKRNELDLLYYQIRLDNLTPKLWLRKTFLKQLNERKKLLEEDQEKKMQ